MLRTPLPRAAGAALLALACTPALAGRPLITEDAGVLGSGECEWESVAAQDKESGVTSHAWSTQLGCGIGLRSQVAAAYGQARAEGVSATVTGVNGKTHLLKSANDATALTLAWGYASAKAAGERAHSTFLNGVLTHQYGDTFTTHLNLGWNRERVAGVSTTATSWSVSGEYNLGHGVELMAELVDNGGPDRLVGVGIRYAASKAWSLNASLHGATSGPSATLFSVGAKLSF